MPSFDIVSEVDLQEARNGVDNAVREVESRFDFRGVEATIELNDANKTIKVLSESDFESISCSIFCAPSCLNAVLKALRWMYRTSSCIAVKPVCGSEAEAGH